MRSCQVIKAVALKGVCTRRNCFQDEKPNVQFNSQFLLCKLTKWIYLVEYDPVKLEVSLTVIKLGKVKKTLELRSFVYSLQKIH